MIKEVKSFNKSICLKVDYIKAFKYSELYSNLDKSDKISIRGSGLSYSAASFSKTATTLDMTEFNRILNFSEEDMTVECEAGIQLGKILNFLLKKGYILDILPGYPFITIGGCIAFNIHGKSQVRYGNFDEIVERIVLYHPKHGELNCDRINNSELFWLTLGGLGLTGLILKVVLKISKLQGNYLYTDKIKVDSIFKIPEEFDKLTQRNYAQVYSWHDSSKLARNNFGQGVIYAEKFIKREGELIGDFEFKKDNLNRIKYKSAPLNFYNSTSLKFINNIYSLLDKLKSSEMPLLPGLFPIYGKEIYFYLFGPKGFYEYQFIVSRDKYELVMESIRKYIKDNNQSVSLLSIKYFKGINTRYLNFSDKGYCVAIDTPNNKKGVAFTHFLDSLASQYRLKINLSKNSKVTSSLVSNIYPEYEKFKRDLYRFDPYSIFQTDLREKLEI